jgi:foldase protein PrsA
VSIQADRPNKGTPRKKQPRRIAPIVEQRERKPIAFGWGADLTHRERESVKERIALFAGILLALIVVGVLGWGWLQDNVITPNNVAADNNRQIALVGNNVIKMGFFKRYEFFEQAQLNTRQTQDQNQIASLQADTKHASQNAGLLSQYQTDLAQVQQQLGNLASGSLTNLIEDQVLVQRASLLGATVTAKQLNSQLITIERQAGGIQHFQLFLANSQLTRSEFELLERADLLRQKVQAKLSARIPKIETKVRVSHILIATKNKALAEKLFKEVLHGANFAKLAKKYSTDTTSAKLGGDLGFFAHGIMVPPFDKAAFAMKVGQIRLVQSSFGWHIIKKTGTERAPPTSAELQQAQQTAFGTWIGKEETALHVQRFVAPASLPVLATATPGVQQLVPTAAAPVIAPTSPPAAPVHTGTTKKK